MTEEKEKNRIFLVCRAKDCSIARAGNARCTVSLPTTILDAEDTSRIITALYNRNLFCARCINPTLLKIFPPKWVVSPDKPGKRKLLEKVKPNLSNVPARLLEF